MKLFLLCFLGSLALSQAKNLPRGGVQFIEYVNKRSENRIIGGSVANESQFPHQAYLDIVTPSGGRLMCGGILISTRWVLTAAHCVDGKAIIFVRLGQLHDFNSPDIIIVETKTFFAHPDYDSYNLNNDIGLIDLGQDIKLSETIQPIRFPTRSQASNTFADVIATISGWGATSNHGTVSDTLNFIKLRVTSNKECLEYYDPVFVVEANLCAVGIEDLTEGVCFGDSGGPLIINDNGKDTLIGVVSFVSSMGCDAEHPSGFGRVTSFLDWISSNTGIPILP